MTALPSLFWGCSDGISNVKVLQGCDKGRCGFGKAWWSLVVLWAEEGILCTERWPWQGILEADFGKVQCPLFWLGIPGEAVEMDTALS